MGREIGTRILSHLWPLLLIASLFLPVVASADLLEFDELHDKTRERYVVELDSRVNWIENSLIGIAIAATDNYVSGFDARSGRVYWQKETQGLQKEAVHVVADMVIIRMDRGAFAENPVSTAYSLVSGAEKWTSRDIRGKVLLAIPLYREGRMVVISSDEAVLGTKGAVIGKLRDGLEFFGNSSTKKMKPYFCCLDMETGQTFWKRQAVNKIRFHATPLGFAGLKGMEYGVMAYPLPSFGSDYGRLFLPYVGLQCIDMQTGGQTWLAKYDVLEENDLLGTNAQSIFDPDRSAIYTSAKGRIRCIQGESGEEVWKTKDYGVVPEMLLDGAEGVLYCRTGGLFRDNKEGKEKKLGGLGVVALDVVDGSEKWRYKKGKGSASNMVDAGDHLIFIADNYITGVDKATGDRRYREKLRLKESPEAIELRPDGTLSLMCENGLAVYDPERKALLWDTFVKMPGLSFWDRMALRGLSWTGQGVARQVTSGDVESYFREAIKEQTAEVGEEMAERASMGGSEEAKRNVYFPVALDDGMRGIAVVNRETGTRETDIVFGKGDRFGYRIDERFVVAYKYTGSKIFGIELSLLKN